MILEDHKFVIISSDGLWRVLKNYNVNIFLKTKKIVEIIAEFYSKNDAEAAADVLLQVA